MITSDFLKEHNINAINCQLHWLCGYTQTEWLKLSSEKRHAWEKQWEEWGRVRPLTPFAGGMSLTDYEREDDLRRNQDVEDQDIFREKYGQE